MNEQPLAVVCDGIRLAAGTCVPGEPRGAALLLHGIPSIAPPEPGDTGYPGLARTFAEAGWAAAWADMRGARGSGGFFSIEGWVRDARAALEALRAAPGAGGLPVAIVGSSAGGAVACELVARGAPVDALVMLAAPAGWVSFAVPPEAGIRRITEEAGMPVSPETLADPRAWVAEFDAVTAERAIAKVTVPTLIVHGTDDDVVPVDHAHRLAERAPRSELRIIDGGGHQLRGDASVVDLVLSWLGRVVSA